MNAAALIARTRLYDAIVTRLKTVRSMSRIFRPILYVNFSGVIRVQIYEKQDLIYWSSLM